MSIGSTADKFVAGLIVIAGLTTVFGRKNSAAVFDSIGRAGSSLLRASLGAGAGVQ